MAFAAPHCCSAGRTARIGAHVLNQKFPGDPEVLYVSVHAYSDLSTQAAQKLARTAPHSLPALEMDAEANEVQGRWDQAEKDYRKISGRIRAIRAFISVWRRLLLSRPNPAPDFQERGKEGVAGRSSRSTRRMPARSMSRANWPARRRISPGRSSTLHGRPNWTETSQMPGWDWECLCWRRRNMQSAIAPLKTAVGLQPENPGGPLRSGDGLRAHGRQRRCGARIRSAAAGSAGTPAARGTRLRSDSVQRQVRGDRPAASFLQNAGRSRWLRCVLKPCCVLGADSGLSLRRGAVCAPAEFTWVHTAGKSAEKYLPETTGAGCAFLDYDNDGWMDIYLVNSGQCDFYDPNPPLRNALYRNNRDGTFTDVTEKAGVAGGGYGQGVAVGDYNGDGFPDLYVTQYGKSILYHNNGDGTFTDVTEKAGVAAPGWSSSAVWFDYDNDGRLDLFVCQFVEFSKSKNLPCVDLQQPARLLRAHVSTSRRASWLFHNNGDGTFSDVSKIVGHCASISERPGALWRPISTTMAGWISSSPTTPTANFLFMNRGAGRFEEIGALAGVAYSETGRARSGMGVDAADFNQDGWLDLFVANIDHEKYSLYREQSRRNASTMKRAAMGIGAATRLMSGWGLKFFDYDNDGDLDLFIANGNPDDLIETIEKDVTYREPLLLFHGDGKTLRNVSAESGPVFAGISRRGGWPSATSTTMELWTCWSRSTMVPHLLLRNTRCRGRHWLGLRLVGKNRIVTRSARASPGRRAI